MKTRPFGMLLLLISAWAASAVPRAYAQHARPQLSAQAALRVGLEPLWSTAIATGYGGKVTGATIYISPEQSYQVIQVTDRLGRTSYFSERDLGPRGTTLGMDQASRLAELKEAELKARGLGPEVEVKSVPDITMYIRSSLGTVIALDAETGLEKWTTQAGVNDYPNYPVDANDEFLATVSGSSLYVIDSVTGQVIETKRLMGVPSARPTLYNGLVYAPTLKGLVEVYDLNNLNKLVFTLGSSGRIHEPLMVAPESISWTTDRGYVYVSYPGEPGINYRFQAFDSFSTAPVRRKDMLIAASMDGSVYAIDERSGEVTWRYSIGEPISSTPLAIDDSLFVITDPGQMLCLDVEQGTSRWSISGMERFLAASQDRLYCVATGQLLVVLDHATGRRIGETPLGQDDLPIMNRKTDRVYVVSDGALQCLAERGRRFPLTWIEPVMPPRSEADELRRPAAGPGERPAVVPPSTAPTPADQVEPFEDVDDTFEPEAEDEPLQDEDPFGGDDPFGTDPFGGDEPFGDDTGAEDAGDNGVSDDESSEEDEGPFGGPF